MQFNIIRYEIAYISAFSELKLNEIKKQEESERDEERDIKKRITKEKNLGTEGGSGKGERERGGGGPRGLRGTDGTKRLETPAQDDG